MEKNTKKKIGKWALRIGTGFVAFAAGLAATFFLVPNRIHNVVFEDPVMEQAEETHFSRFVSKIMNTIDEENEEKIEGVVGKIKNLRVDWPNNYVAVDGSLAFEMRNLNDFDLTVDLEIDYNTKEIDVGLGYVGKTFYLAINDDFMIKSSYTNSRALLENVYRLFFDASVPAEEGLGITLDIDNIIDGLIGGIDINALMGGGSVGGLGISFGEEVKSEQEGIVEAPLTITLGEDKDPLEIVMYINEETNDLAGVNLKSIKIGNVSVSGELTFQLFSDHDVLTPEDENYEGKQRCIDGKHYVEVINYQSWFKDIFELINKKVVGLDLEFSADQKEGDSAVNIGSVSGKIDVDASKFILPIPKIINWETFSTPEDEPVVKRTAETDENGEPTVLEEVLDNLNVGVDLSVNKETAEGIDHYADVNVTYAEQNGYLSLNDDSLKAQISNKTINYLVSEITELVEGSDTERARRAANGQEEGPFDFITNSDLVTAITTGHYEGIIDLIKEASSSENGIKLALNLSSLNLGDNSLVELELDAADNGEKGVVGINCENIEMAEGIFNLKLNTRDYNPETIQNVLNNKDSYDSLDFATGVFEQVTGILDNKQAGFSLSGSLLDGKDTDVGMYFDGKGQFDYGVKYGFGDIALHKRVGDGKPDEDHPIQLYVDNTTQDSEVNAMKLAYGPNHRLKGKLNVRSLEDILGVVGKIIDKKDPRFMKFLDPILNFISDSVLVDVIRTKDWMSLAKKSFIKSIRVNGNALEMNLSKDLFAKFLAEDLVIALNLKDVGDTKQLTSVEIKNMCFSEILSNKVVNCKIEILDFDPSAKPAIDLNANYLDFSTIATLLEFGIDSTELNSYHLTAKAHVNALSVFNIDVPLDFYIEVNDKDTKVYGRIIEVPKVIIVSNDYLNLVSTEFLFEPAKHFDPSSVDTIGGYFHILRSEEHIGGLEQYYYRATSSGFVDNILQYLLCSVINFRFTLIEKIGDLNLDSEKNVTSYEDMFNENGFLDKSSPADNKYEWDVSMNLAKLSGIDALRSLDAKIYGNKTTNKYNEEKSYLNKLDASMLIQASIAKIYIDATIELKDINPDAEGWSDQFPDINTRYESIVNLYNGMTTEKQEAYNAAYLDNPEPNYTVKLDKSFPSFLRP
ncbi:MAG: hypothetical protein KBS97_02925 [Firmicutes bacterium]|nr:hypothetical protein [Candidatus Fiminaster equi]